MSEHRVSHCVAGEPTGDARWAEAYRARPCRRCGADTTTSARLCLTCEAPHRTRR